MGLLAELSEEIKDASRRAFGPEGGIELPIDVPPKADLGDFAVGCFPLAGRLGRSPKDIATELAAALSDGGSGLLVRAEAAGPYVNLTVASSPLFAACRETAGESRGTVMVEYLSPNTNKPLHLGHVRNGCLGTAVASLLRRAGYRVIRAEIVNDRGIHIMKSLLAWQRFGNGETPESTGEKGDHFVGRYYVRFARESEADPLLKDEAQELLRRWEAGDREVRELWERMNGWVYAGFDETCRRYGFAFDQVDYESDTYRLGKEIVEDGLRRGVFLKAEDGSAYFPLEESEFGLNEDGSPKRLTLLRGDGTSVYVTQDLGTAFRRFEEGNLSRLVYVVGSEQVYHFRTLTAAIRALGKGDWADGLKHLSYGMVYLPDGKMKSREGKVVDADNLLDEMAGLAEAAVREKHAESALSDGEIRRRAEAIGLGSIKFHLLKSGAVQDMRFNPEESLSFDGMTGPYCQYAYARIRSILAKARRDGLDWGGADLSLLGGNVEERALARNLALAGRKAAEAAESLNPSVFLAHVYDLAKAFNQFYHKHPVLAGEDVPLKSARLAFLERVGEFLAEGLGILGIGTLEEM